MKKPFLTALIVLFVVIIGVVLFYYFIIRPSRLSPEEKKRQEADRSLQSGRQLLNTGDSQSAVPWLEQAATQAVDINQRSRAELNLGDAYLYGGEPKKGIEILKAVAANPDYPVGYRSTAAQDIIALYIGGKDIDFALNTIFTGPIWGGFMEGNSKDVAGLNIAVRNAWLWIVSLDTSDTNLSSFSVFYRLAHWYAEDSLSQTGTNKDKDIEQAQKYLELGNTMYPQILKANVGAKQQNANAVPPFALSVIGNALTLKARALGSLYLAKNSTVTLAVTEQAFHEALTLVDSDSSGFTTGLYSHFHYAQFLARADSVANKKEIQGTLSPIYYNTAQYKTNPFYQGFLKLYGSDARFHNSLTWRDIVTLAKIDPRFKTLLISLGWSPTDLK